MSKGIAAQKSRTRKSDRDSPSRGKVTVVGIGPGSIDHLTNKAMAEIRAADCIVGFSPYVEQVRGAIRPGTTVYSSSMGHEVDRALQALKWAAKGRRVALVSGGDPGVYGMAGPVLETARKLGTNVEVNIVPGVTAATASAAGLGAPLMNDFAVISLSDLLTPRKKILERVKSAVKGDFVLVLYNPQSRQRKEPLRLVHRMLRKYRKLTTPVGIVSAYSRMGEKLVVTTLEQMLDHDIDMTSTIIVGNSSTVAINRKMLTPRGYFRSK